MPIITKQQLENAALDAATLESVINDDATPGTVTSRLGTTLKSLAKITLELSEQDIGDGAAALINQRLDAIDERLYVVELAVGVNTSSSVVRLLPSGLVWAVDGAVEGTADSDTNIVVSELVDLIGTTSFVGIATTSKRPRQLAKDYLANGRKSLLFANGTTEGQQQYLADSVVDNSIWKPLWRYELAGNTGATLVVSFIPRGTTSGHVIGNFPGSSAGPGFVIYWNGATETVVIATFKNGVLLTISSTGVATRSEKCTVAIVSGAGDNTYSHIVNGTVVSSGVTNSAAVEQTITVPVTIGAEANSGGATNGFGGHLLFAGLWHTPLSTPTLNSVFSVLDNWYDCPAWTITSSPVSGVSIVSNIDIAVCGTSIDTGANDTAGGWIKGLASGGLGSGLTATFVGKNDNYATADVKCMALGGGMIRGLSSIFSLGFKGFDSIAADTHSLRMEQQLSYMDTNGMLADGRTLVCVLPIGWTNDLSQVFARPLLHDNQGDFIRMVKRLYDSIMAYDVTHDVRFVLCTDTPIGGLPTIQEYDVIAVNKSLGVLANEVRNLTGRPVAIVDTHTIINSNLATYLTGDSLHLTTAGHAALVTPIKNAIRYVCGRS